MFPRGARRRSSRKSSSERVAIDVQPLEPRVLFAAGISISGTRLIVTGTSGPDVIEVTPGAAAGSVVARLNDTNRSFEPGDVRSLLVTGQTGNDSVTVTDGVSLIATLRGDGGDDTLRAGAGDTTLLGGDGNDRLFGGAGWDKLDGGAGADVISGGAGRDWVNYSSRTAPLTVTLDGETNDGEAAERDNVRPDVENVDGGAGDDRITGSFDDNSLVGGAGDDVLSGLGGDDDLYGYAGNDTMIGGRGNDTFNSSDDTGDDVMDGGEGNDVLFDGEGNDRLLGGPGHDRIGLTGPGDFVDGGPDPDQVGQFTEPGFTGTAAIDGGVLVVRGTGTSDDVLLEPSGAGVVVRVNFFDASFSFADFREIRVETGDADDRINITPNDDLAVPVTVLAGGGDDYATNTNAGPATLDGGAGDDRLTGGDGPDLLRGGAGNDRLFGNDGDDTLIDTSGTNVLEGGPGRDRVNGELDGDPPDSIRLEGTTLILDGTDAVERFSIGEDARASQLVYDVRINDHRRSFRPEQITRVVINARGGDDLISLQVPVAATVEAGDGNDSVFTSDANDTISGGGGADRITSLGGNDEVSGGAGNDIINSGRGTDRVLGGDGEDELTDPDGTAGLDGGGGNDTINGVPDSAGGRITLQAEDAAALVGVSRVTANIGNTGTGYADFSRDTGAYIEWVVESPAAASKVLIFRYANGGSTDRPLELSVNGQIVRPRLSFPSTGSWSVWRTTGEVVVPLRQGANRIRVTSVGSNGANIDAVSVGDVATPAPQTLQAEHARLSGAVVSTSRSGYEGSGFADYQNAAGDFVEWNVEAAAAGRRTLTFRYANGGPTNRPLALSVNGTVVNPRVSFESTGSWTTWRTVSVTVTLPFGDNAVRLTATGSSGPNIDWLRVS